MRVAVEKRLQRLESSILSEFNDLEHLSDAELSELLADVRRRIAEEEAKGASGSCSRP
jgi:hypothetical protein